MKNQKYNIGDEVKILSSGLRGVIKDISTYYGDERNIYLVDVAGKEKVYTEKNLELSRKKNNALTLNFADVTINFQIEDKIKNIIKELDLRKPESEDGQLLNAAKLQRYLVTNRKFNEETKCNIGNSVITNQLYHGLIDGKTDCIVNSFIFSEILNKTGNNVLNVAFKDEFGKYYVSNLVLIGDEYYYFDTTLEKDVFVENGSDLSKFILCAAALGRKNYEEFFKPLCLIDFQDSLAENLLPDNIAVNDIDIDIVNRILFMDDANEK
jgi:hypothetical protein